MTGNDSREAATATSPRLQRKSVCGLFISFLALFVSSGTRHQSDASPYQRRYGGRRTDPSKIFGKLILELFGDPLTGIGVALARGVFHGHFVVPGRPRHPRFTASRVPVGGWSRISGEPGIKCASPAQLVRWLALAYRDAGGVIVARSARPWSWPPFGDQRPRGAGQRWTALLASFHPPGSSAQ